MLPEKLLAVAARQVREHSRLQAMRRAARLGASIERQRVACEDAHGEQTRERDVDAFLGDLLLHVVHDVAQCSTTSSNEA